jgi:hypothetical protein
MTDRHHITEKLLSMAKNDKTNTFLQEMYAESSIKKILLDANSCYK